jgi:O-methyltransferase involved in polyketide biosynthesis
LEVAMTEKAELDLGAAQETLLVPLYGRATMTRQGSDLIADPKAVEMVDAIDYDFSRLDGSMSLVGSVLRTRIVDRWVSRWLEANPTGTIVEIGAGLNTRYERLDNGQARWFELDLPDTTALRRRFFADTERRTMLAASVLDDDWHAVVAATGGPWFFAAEAVLIYLEATDVEAALRAIGQRFPGSPVAFDTWGTWMRDNQDSHDTIGHFDARFTWFCDDLADLAARGVDLDVQERYTFVDAPAELLELLPPALREMLPAVADDPQMTSYHQNLVTIRPRPLDRGDDRSPGR